MAEGSEQERRDADAPARTEWFGRSLGADWVEVEPGIYEHRPLQTAEPPATPAPPAEKPLDEDLIESLPKPPPAPDPEPVGSEPAESSEWWRFRL